MPYTFTPAQQAEITLRHGQGPLENQPGNFVPMYGYIAQVLQTPQPSNGGLPPDADQIIKASRLWFQGAFYANGGGGSPSRLIREYTQTQGVLHNGGQFSESVGPIGLQEASNNVARRVYEDLSNDLNWRVPDTVEIADNDAIAVGTTLFEPTAGSVDSAGDDEINAAWAGTILFQFLRPRGAAAETDETDRLVSKGSSLSDADVMDDWRNLLFAQHSFEVANAAVLRWSAYDLFSASWFEAFNGLDEDGATSVAFESASYSGIGASTTVLPAVLRNSVIQDDFIALGSLPVERSLVFFRSAYIGSFQQGTSKELFTSRARSFFVDQVGRVPGQTLSTSFVPTENLEQNALAGDLESRQSLDALTPYVVSGGASAAPAPTLAQKTPLWVADRTDMLDVRLRYDASRLAYTPSNVVVLPFSSANTLYVDSVNALQLGRPSSPNQVNRAPYA